MSIVDDALHDAGDTREVVIGEGVLDAVPGVFDRGFGDAAAVVVADETTWRVAGERVSARLAASRVVLGEPFVFASLPVLDADYANVRAFAGSLAGHAAVPIVVGSGTLNDIAKRACFECGRSYMTVATAASMDGYTAFGAAITKDGFKQTLGCPAPRALVADLAVLAGAPDWMTASGYADLLAKVCAGGDWILADALEIEAIDVRPWSIVQNHLRGATGDPDGLRARDTTALTQLIEGLVLSGLAMQVAGSSRPGSGAEHQFSHLWEMEGLGQHPGSGRAPLSHGFKVGLGTLAIGALYERLIARDLTRLDVDAAVAAWPSWPAVEQRVRAAYPVENLSDPAVRETREKYVPPAELRRRLELVRARWPQIRDRLCDQLLPAAELSARLRAAGCPTTPTEIGLTLPRLRATYRRAQMIRRRFTVLDLADQLGLLEPLVAELFAQGGFWAQPQTLPASAE
jgi:glycerol-1-phosphate dehydrogenase [NAD(P)+]